MGVVVVIGFYPLTSKRFTLRIYSEDGKILYLAFMAVSHVIVVFV